MTRDETDERDRNEGLLTSESESTPSDATVVAHKRLSRQLRNFLDPLIKSYYQYIVGDTFLYDRIDGGERVLDVGCGVGRFGYLLSGQYDQFVGIDLSRQATSVAANVVSNPAAAFAVGDGVSLPFRSKSFDLVLAIGTFNRIDELYPFLTEFERVLTPEGRAIFNCNNQRTVVPHKRNRDFGHHTVEGIQRVLNENGFKICDIEVGFFTSRLEKKLILSDRMPVELRYIGLQITRIQETLLSHLPRIGNKGAHIWVEAQKQAKHDGD